MTRPLLRLISTPLSHFGRKPQALLDLYKLNYAFIDIGNVALTKTPSEAGNHPLMKVPVLEYGDMWMVESDHIAGYIVDLVDSGKLSNSSNCSSKSSNNNSNNNHNNSNSRSNSGGDGNNDKQIDRYRVWTRDVFDLNARAIMNGIMTDEVKVIAAGRHQVPVREYSYFNKCYDSVKNGLQWLENNHEKLSSSSSSSSSSASITYRDIHLVCLYEHLLYYDFVPLSPYPQLKYTVDSVNYRCPTLQQTSPFVVKPK